MTCTAGSATGATRVADLDASTPVARRSSDACRAIRVRVRRTRRRRRRSPSAQHVREVVRSRRQTSRTIAVAASCSIGREERAAADMTRILLPRMVFRGQTLGKYRILEPLGSGGFGTVYLAEDTWIDKRVAIKVPHRQNLDFGELLREPRLLASLNHPNIVTVITAEKQDNVFFIVMEYVPGRDARDDHRQPGRARPRDGARLHLPDRQRRRARAQAGRHPPRPAAGERLRDRKGTAEGRRLRHVAIPRDRGARHDGHRQPAVHGAGTVRRAGGVRVGPLLARRDDVSDADRRRCRTTRRRRRTSIGCGAASWSSRRASRNPRSRRSSTTSSCARSPAMSARAISAPKTCSTDILERAARCWSRRPAPPPAAIAGGPRRRGPTPRRSRPTPSRIRTREISASRFCWNCRKPLPARGSRCPFCGETQ